MPRPKDGAPPPVLFPAAAFAGFGPSLFHTASHVIAGRKLTSRRAARLKEGVRDHAPRQPGVYAMHDAKGRIIYVGKAKNLRCRLLSYFRVQSRDAKAGRILKHTRALAWEEATDEFAALLRELELIQRLTPRFNVLGLPGHQRHHYICMGKSPAPYVYLTAKPTGKELGCYGPLVARPRSEDAARRLNDWFKLRDCPQTVPLAFADQPPLFPLERSPQCLRFEIGNCAGPCVGACSRQEYSSGARQAKAFLDGRDRTILTDLRTRMLAAAESLQFEKAGALRDRLAALEWIDERLALLRRARNQDAYVYPLTGADGVERWYLIHRGCVSGVVLPAKSAREKKHLQAWFSTLSTGKSTAMPLSELAVDSVLLVAAWFRKHIGEKARLLTLHEARKKCG